MLLLKVNGGWKIMDGRASQSLSTPPLMGADSAIHQLIYIHGTVPELAVKCRALFYLCKSPTLSLSSSPQLKMSLAFCITFWQTVGGFLYVYTAKVWLKFDVVQQNELCLQVLWQETWLIPFIEVVLPCCLFDPCCRLAKSNSTTRTHWIAAAMPQHETNHSTSFAHAKMPTSFHCCTLQVPVWTTNLRRKKESALKRTRGLCVINPDN